jgi:ATP-dependent RNA helicase RhlE
LVFTRTKHGADRVARQLNKVGIRAEAMHGNKSQSARQRTLAGFKSKQPPVLVATDVAARGIDVDGVSHVFNYDLPHEPEMYVHRIGRTGRAGATGIAVSFCEHEERKLLQAIERLIRRKLLVDHALTGEDLDADLELETVQPQAPKPQATARRWRGSKPNSARPSSRPVAGKRRRW